MGFLNRFLSKFTNRASDKLADKAVNKIFGKGNENKNISNTEFKTPQTDVENTTTATQPEQTNNNNTNAAQMAILNALANQTAQQQANINQINMAQVGMAQATMAQANEMMNYLIFNDNLEVIGVKDNAPDYLKIAFKNGKLKN